jgi:mono/diheme cytochrome c family protein
MYPRHAIRWFTALCWLLVAGLLLAGCANQSSAPRFADQPTPTGETAAFIYAQRCSTCHADRGQGLTAEWRATWPETHQNCATSKCHGPNHPEDGFALPNNYAPAVIGPETLARFDNALALHAYVANAMPWSAPGTMPPDQYWKVVNFLLWTNGYIDVPYGVTADNAAGISLKTRPYSLPEFTPAAPGVIPIDKMTVSDMPAP